MRPDRAAGTSVSGGCRPVGLLAVFATLLACVVALLAGCAAPAPGGATCYQSRWLDKYVCEKPVISKVAYADLRLALRTYFEKMKQQGVLAEAGLYFRDLEDGPHLGVNEYTDFAAASLLKLPVVIQYLKLSESEPELLTVNLIVPPGMELLYSVVHKPPVLLVAGEAHSVEELLFRTMAYSDNLAFVMLRKYLVERYGEESILEEAYRQLGLVPEVSDKNYVITVQRYASIFKLIYSASFLNAAMSEKFVEMMLGTSFDQGLVKGVPPGIPVAHKFGELERDGIVNLHDCGIVYYPGNPYVLCVMTRGHSHAELTKVIGEVSRMVFDEVDSRRGRLP